MLLRFGTRGLLIVLVVVCTWLGLLTHYALSVVEERHRSRIPIVGQPPLSSVGETTPHIGERQATTPVVPSSVAEKTLSLQISVLRQKLLDAESEATNARSSLEAKVRSLEEQLTACRKAAADAATPPPDQWRQWTPPPPPPRPTAPPGLNEYEQEQWKVRQFQQEQRDRMMQARRDVVNAQRPTLAPYLQHQQGGAPPYHQEQSHPQGAQGGAAAAPDSNSIGVADHVDHLMANVARHGPIIPVVIVAYQRAEVLRKCIDTVLRRMPSVGFQLFASQDGREFPDVTALLDEYQRRGKLVHMIHERNTSGGTDEEYAQGWEPYFAISHHFQFVLSQLFDHVVGYDRAILVEEDIEVGVDFFEYMAAMSPLLDQDNSLYCVSAWNDNGKAGLIADPKAVYRTDFFPGLGWMLSRSLWEELRPIWPNGFWDDWLRQPAHRRGRSCLRPEVPRSFTWCTPEGVSQGQFCAEHLANIKLADTAINWKAMDLSVLTKDAYDGWLSRVVEGATEVRSVDELDRVNALTPHEVQRMDPGPMGTMPSKEVKLYYHTNQEYEHYAQLLSLMDDFKDDIPRTAYKGVVTFRRRQLRVHLVPAQPLYR